MRINVNPDDYQAKWGLDKGLTLLSKITKKIFCFFQIKGE